MATIFSFPSRVKSSGRPSRHWTGRETKAARYHRLRGWRPIIQGQIAAARTRQRPMLYLAPPPTPELPPARIAADEHGKALVGEAPVDAYHEARQAGTEERGG